MSILRTLLFKQTASFSELNVNNSDSEAMAYHLKTLAKQDLISKDENGIYSLTQKGKQYSADIDVDTSMISSRAKLSILVTAVDRTQNEDRYLLIRRLKSPLYGAACFIAGKVRYGEAASLTAVRELEEESGLVASTAEFVCFHRQFVFNSQQEFLKDNAFCMFMITDFTGSLKATPEADPFWVSKMEFEKLTNKAYDLDDLFGLMTNPPASRFIEKEFVTQEF
jgi:8-oxo-dGTP pyrophosphatase MutT (NUDIX family)